jgi:hypothetical protein
MRRRYIVFNASQERPLKETSWHDCMLSIDMEWISLTSLWRCARDLGYDPVLLLACAAGKTAKELCIEGEGYGAFSHFAQGILRDAPKSTHRELVMRVNHCFRSIGLDQQCEVICRRGLLHRPFLSSDFTMISDACRSRPVTPKGVVYPVTGLEASGSYGQVSRAQLRRFMRRFGKSDQNVFTFSGHGAQLCVHKPKNPRQYLGD